MADLTERDRGLLNNKIDDLNKNNLQLQDGIDSDQREVNNLTLFDIPYKKDLDEKHYNIYAYEEEMRLLNGRTIIGPVEEDAFVITTLDTNVTLNIKDGRFIAKKGLVEFVNVPLIPYRGYVVGSSCGANFDIWTRDRYGSSTSAPGVPQSYTVHSGNNKFKAVLNGTTYEVNIFDSDILDANNGKIVVDTFVLSSSIGNAFSAISGLDNTQCVYNAVRQTFTLVSNTAGSSSTVEVILGGTNEIAYEMKFNNQTMVPGRFANNKLKVSIDGVVHTLQLMFDVRVPIYSAALGYAWDDFSADWRLDFSKGPLFPAENNNGRKIATMIQTKLRENAEDGYKKAECFYYTDSEKFIIYSSTFGQASSVEVLPADDSSRDLAPFVGLDVITDFKRNEVAYTTLTDLYNFLNNWTNLQCLQLQNPTFSCYSLMSLLLDISLSAQKLILQTTSEYDKASLALPRLYGNKITVNSSNASIDLNEGSGEVTRVIPYGDYGESDLAQAIQDVLNVGSVIYTVTYKKLSQQLLGNFIITASTPVTFLFNTGINISRAITTYIGFQNTANLSGTSFTSNLVTFSGVDFFSMAEIPQLVPKSYFNYYPPYYIDWLSGEQNWLSVLLILLESEDNTGTDILDLLKNQIDFFNEAYLNHWETVTALELLIESSQYEALRQEIAFYSRISTTDAEYLRKVAAMNDSLANVSNLQSFSQHGSIMNLRQSTSSFIISVAFNESQSGLSSNPTLYPDGGTLTISILNPNDDRIYNQPAPEFRYVDNKYLPMHFQSFQYIDSNNVTWPPTPLYSNNVVFQLFEQLGFTIQSNKTATSGYAVSGIDGDDLFTIDQSSDTSATMLSLNSEPYDLSAAGADLIEVSVDGTAVQSTTLLATAAYVEGVDVLSDGVFTITPSNDIIDYNDGADHFVTITSGVYKGSDIATEIQNKLQTESPLDGFTVAWAANQFTISSTISVQYKFISGAHFSVSIGKMIGFTTDVSGFSILSAIRHVYVQNSINGDFTFIVNSFSTGQLTLTEGDYTDVQAASNLQTMINSALGTVVSVAVDAAKIKVSTIARGYVATINKTVGVYDFLRSIYMDSAVPVNGTGDVFDITKVTAAEVGDKIAVFITGLVAYGEGPKVRATTTSTLGQLSSISFTLNSLALAVGLIDKPKGVDQNNKIGVTIDGVDTILSLTTSALPIPGTTVATDIQAKLRAVGSGGFTNAYAYYNRFDFPHAFKIISGTSGPSSTVYITEKTIVVTLSDNAIDFSETIGVQLTTTIIDGSYTGQTLATACQNALNAVGSSTYAVIFNGITSEFSVSSDGSGGAGIFTLLFGSGTNTALSIATIVGFYKTDKTGLLAYQGDAPVKLRQAVTQLNYDIQTNQAGTTIIDTRLTVTSSNISSVVYLFGGGSNVDFDYSFSNYPTVKSLVDVLAVEQPDYATTVQAQLWSRYPEKYVVFDGDEFIIQIGTDPEQVVTFNGVNGSSFSDANPDSVAILGDTLTLSINGEAAQTITLPTGTMNGSHTASLIQTIVRTLNATFVENQPAYTNFVCIYQGGLYYLVSGTSGQGSTINVTGGTLKTKLKLGNNELIGSGDFLNNYFVTYAEIQTKFAVLINVTVSNDNGFIKLLSDRKITISSTDCATRFGFYADNLEADSDVVLNDVASTSLQRFSNQMIHVHSQIQFILFGILPLTTLTLVSPPYTIQSGDVVQVINVGGSLPPPLTPGTNYYAIAISPTQIQLAASFYDSQPHPAPVPIVFTGGGSGINYVQPNPLPYEVKRGYEDRGDITATFFITDDSLIDSRRPIVATRKINAASRMTEISSRVTDILAALTPSLYNDRWVEVKKRLNKKSGSYYAVGQKQLGIIRSQQQISDNNTIIGEIQAMLGA